jgi:putative tryptophan/tyrosine transport system substrate-binding protein
MRRREFMLALGGAAAPSLLWPLAARAQQSGPMPVIGFLSSGSQQSDAERLAAFWGGLNETGHFDGRNVESVYRWADDQYNRLPALVVELIGRQPAVIVAIGGPTSALAAKAATKTIPIVFTIAGDPVKLGLVVSLSRPGGNLTGVTTLSSLVVGKQFEVLHETVPQATVIGCLVNPVNPNTESDIKEAREAARALGLQLHVLNASAERDIEAAFATFVQNRADAVVVVSDALFNSRPNELVVLAARHALPTIYSLREFAAAGGLMSYGTSLGDAYRQTGLYAGRILKGGKPADLPAVQATKVELILNFKTARTLGITFPISLLGRADEVIE